MLGYKPDISNLRVFGCPAAVLIQTHLPKLASKINKCLYIGPNQEGEGDRFYNLSTRKIIISRNATFFENVAHPTTNFTGVRVNAGLLPATPADTSTAVVPAGASSAHSASAPVGASAPIVDNRYPLRQRKGTDCFNPSFYNKIMAKAFATATEPQNHNQAINSPDAAFWLAAEKEEINNLLSNKTWDLVELPPNRKAIGVCGFIK